MGELTDADLLAYLDGVVSPEAAAQIERSPELMERVRALKHLETGLRARLLRAECPDPHLLGEYWLGLLSSSQAGQVRRHIHGCPRCADELRSLEAFMAPGLGERVKKIAASLLSGGALGGLQAAAGLRGGEPGPRIYAAGSRQVILETQPTRERPGRWSLLGLVTGSPAGEMEAQLLGPDLLPLSARVSELGDFQFEDLAAGEYLLRLATAEEEIQVPPFTIAEP